jgi:hypothetical protein
MKDYSGYLFILILTVIGSIALHFLKKKKEKIESLGNDTYKRLKDDINAGRTNAKRIMEEMNYMIDEVSEYQEQMEYFRKSYETIKNNNPLSMGSILINPEGHKKIREEADLFKHIKKQLDDYIKKEWNPRIRILRDNSVNYYSDKELRNAYTQFVNADKEIQKLTIEGTRTQEFNKSLKVAGIGVLAVTGLALGAVGAANRFGDRQSIRDNLDI